MYLTFSNKRDICLIMNVKTFELSLTQLETAFGKSKNNKYADQRKKTHFEQMLNVFIQIKKADYKSFPITEIHIHNSMSFS